jgi:hypothetical protein
MSTFSHSIAACGLLIAALMLNAAYGQDDEELRAGGLLPMTPEEEASFQEKFKPVKRIRPNQRFDCSQTSTTRIQRVSVATGMTLERLRITISRDDAPTISICSCMSREETAMA